MSPPNGLTPSPTVQESGSDTGSPSGGEPDHNDASLAPTTSVSEVHQAYLDSCYMHMQRNPWLYPAPLEPQINFEDLEEVDLNLDLGEDLDDYNPVVAAGREQQGELNPNSASGSLGDTSKDESTSEDVETRPATSAGSERSGIAAPHTIVEPDSIYPNSRKHKLESSEDESEDGADTIEEAHHQDGHARTSHTEDGDARAPPLVEQPEQPPASLAPEQDAPSDVSSEATTVIQDTEEEGEREEAPATTTGTMQSQSLQPVGGTCGPEPGCSACSGNHTAVALYNRCGCRLARQTPSVTQSERSPATKRRKRNPEQ
ncbi:hypothetical protein BKA63DRAFT_190266 [Paraphoma chrysanthemicola]|nr:hypothetical protein BKA63DRAFT_190266 [Paraphoma chrysanthemicola]